MVTARAVALVVMTLMLGCHFDAALQDYCIEYAFACTCDGGDCCLKEGASCPGSGCCGELVCAEDPRVEELRCLIPTPE